MKNGIICAYYHDASGSVTDRAVYEPDVETLNRVIAAWEEQNIQWIGLVHSHLSGQTSLSTSDKHYIRSVFTALPEQVEHLYFPIVLPGEGYIIPFIAKRNGEDVRIRRDEIQIV